jgi:Spy/CpxP family protein refolding chaperone
MAQAPASLGGRWRLARRVLAALVVAFALSPAFAAGSKPDPRWHELTAPQREILAPLAGEWNRLDRDSRKRWLGVAKRYPKMTPVGQKRVQTRMKKWAALTPQQREAARAKYKTMKRKRGSKELKSEWQRYQALSPEQRQALAAGERKRKTKSTRKRAAPASEEFSQ